MALYCPTYYPQFGLETLRKQRKSRWQELVDHISALRKSDEQVMAMTMTLRDMRRKLNMPRHLCRDPFCTLDAIKVIEAYGSSEDELLTMYKHNLDRVRFAKSSMRFRDRRPIPVKIDKDQDIAVAV